MPTRPSRGLPIPLLAAATFFGVYALTPAEWSDARGSEAPEAQASTPRLAGTGFDREPVAAAPNVAAVSAASAVSAVSAPYYRYCSDARAAGAAPLRRGDPGYASHLDRDNDGIACEPH
jgi:Excalibur calcium-binding domain